MFIKSKNDQSQKGQNSTYWKSLMFKRPIDRRSLGNPRGDNTLDRPSSPTGVSCSGLGIIHNILILIVKKKSEQFNAIQFFPWSYMLLK